MGKNRSGLVWLASWMWLSAFSVFLCARDGGRGNDNIVMPDSLESPGQARYVHVIVALCDNVNQGIVKVPRRIGNGQDPANNLYWGCGFGVKTFFKKHRDWKLISEITNPAASIHERLVFRHANSPVFMVADAYDGAAIRQAIGDFLGYAAGQKKARVTFGQLQLKTGGDADLICYVGHNGLMDFAFDVLPARADQRARDVMIMACLSRDYFGAAMKKAGARPLLWTTGLMCPEAYTLAAAIGSWIGNEAGGEIREVAAQVYSRYQKCGVRGARSLLVTGY